MRIARPVLIVAAALAVLLAVLALRPKRTPFAQTAPPPAPVATANPPPRVDPPPAPPPPAPRPPEPEPTPIPNLEAEWNLTCRRGSLEVSGEKTRVGYDFDTGREADRGDLTLYFDNDDCSEGALLGHNDRDLIHPLGKKTPAELAQVGRLTAPAPGLVPLDADKEGAAFVVKRKNGTYAIVRLAKVTPSTFEQLKRGGTARIEFEWRPFTPLR